MFVLMFQTRLSSLSLIVEAQKTTEPYTPEELKLVMEYVSHNMNLEFPASRQRNIALLGKVIYLKIFFSIMFYR